MAKRIEMPVAVYEPLASPIGRRPLNAMFSEINQPLKQVQQRYVVMVLLIAVTVAALLMAGGYRSLGKGLVLGVIFSAMNFTLMALLLPYQFSPQRRKNTFVSLGSIVLRYGVMAIPLVICLNSAQFALSTVVIGLFGIQLVILGDHLWARARDAFLTR